MTLLLDHVRDVIGLPMRGVHAGYHVGWTTDADKADAARKVGARCTYCAPFTTRGVAGWEVAFAVGRKSPPLPPETV